MNIKPYILWLLLFLFHSNLWAQIQVRGKIVSAGEKQPLVGASIQIPGSIRGTIADAEGNFSIQSSAPAESLVVSFIGYKRQLVSLKTYTGELLTIYLEPESSQFDEVVVVSTGYEQIPRERATGSFAFVNAELINRSPGTNILNRLEDLASGLTFNRDGSTQGNNISIRSLGTIYANDQPLIVIDNFPYEGDIRNLNPSDVASITLLKDAAAASIWGARAGNGVIVITTKKGKAGKQQITVKSDVVWGSRPNLFYKPRMSTAEYMGMEKLLFERGYYTAAETSLGNTPLTPVVELLIARRDGTISAEAAQAEISRLESLDLRNDYSRYLYRNSLLQQYAMNLSGGTTAHRYYWSAGYDRNLSASVGDQFNRLTLNLANHFSFLQQKLELGTGIYFTRTTDQQNSLGTLNLETLRPLYPYARLADESGNALAIVKDYRTSFVQNAALRGLYDWTYRPLEELNRNDNTTLANDLRLNLNMKYLLIRGLQAEVQYQAGLGNALQKQYYSPESYFTRDLINNYTQVGTNGTLTYPIPKGGILDQSQGYTVTHHLRGQLSYKNISNDAEPNPNRISLLAGAEVYDRSRWSSRNRFYGYDDRHATLQPVDYIGIFTQYSYPTTSKTIPFRDGRTEQSDRGISYYLNGAYTYLGRYTFSASARLDQSNLFGVKTNQRGVPLYSTGLSWDIAQEQFYHWPALPYLRLRATYGYNGNIDKTTSAYTTAYYFSSAAQTRLPYAQIINPPNPQLRWERVGIFNGGLDWETRNSRWKGSLEFYAKKSTDLIGDTPYAPSSGITSFRGNIANMTGKGMDLEVSRQHTTRGVRWQSVLLLSYAADKITNYQVQSSTINYLQSIRLPMNNQSLYTLYALEWGGLNPLDGSPTGLLEGKSSTDYTRIIQTTPTTGLLSYAARPRLFGSIRNNLVYKKLSLSFNIAYRLGYFFRRESVVYSDVLAGNGGHGDFSKRWMQPGDELKTQVPSLPLTASANRDNMYRYSTQLIENGNHIRLRDVRLQYDLSAKHIALFKSAQLYFYANNLGLLYRANKQGIDPDYPDMPSAPSVSFGFNLQF
ncbi:SusC/RagA family TonB-linked outer membrane protein [Emticicia sp. 21SJ11W-3]|uniref:SusC/RagA family TonB-linked outer membrane protein n=1 Tax=Emticicia sp. 21SJ11W-3 TaxID=2916755 RepID=UPI00209CDA41|nr:SusC/RagA family TonB-linked outer membrane protein [Emticicia sp. 21SJ11W-3]UTA67277.1 SusC/RagA family TonB-linked outer membrane protein [Emticicia sp. 21SJ11W-3]